ncbi:MAG: polysaccharide biosynthesis protein [Lentimicrobiaceae bacterium]|nr:polysaccharide biosynthesis protein [Lentimicrobiaceae bacterium]
MKNPIKALAGQTVIYGLGTIVPRLLNYLLTPFYVRVFVSGEYGQISELYAWIALLLAILTFGMETTFFRFSQKEDSGKVFNNAETIVLLITAIFLILYGFFYKSFAELIHYEFNTHYVLLLGIIVAIDAAAAIPFAMLRKENKAGRFSLIKTLNVLTNIFFNILFLVIIPEKSMMIAERIFGEQTSLLIWVFISNIIASLLNLILLSPQLSRLRISLDKELIVPMLKYSFPILLISLVGMVNEVADKILIKYLVTIPDETTLAMMNITGEEYAMQQLGIYSANFKLGVLMTIFIQMFRFASEPFFFGHAKDRNAPTLYAKVMTYFVIFCLLIFLGVMFYMDILQHFVGRNGSDYREGLRIVPIILIANMFYGIVFNLSIWFKLSDKTYYGTIIAVIGSIVTLLCFFILIPRIGYMGAAIAHLACYTVMMSVSYFWGQRIMPIPYQIGRITIYCIVAAILFFVSTLTSEMSALLKLSLNTMMILMFLGIVFIMERKNPLKIE